MKTTIIILTLLLLPIYVTATILNVPDDFETIQGAINESEDGDTVLVQPGEYIENLVFEDRIITILSDPDNPDDVIIDGDGAGSVIHALNCTLELAGVTVRNGAAGNGGGIYAFHSSITIDRCNIENNSAEEEGGGLCFGRCDHILIANSRITGNSALLGGAFAGGTYDDVTIFNKCLFTGNTAAFGSITKCWGYGGYNLVNCTMADNVPWDRQGPALWFVIFRAIGEPTVTVSNCILRGNGTIQCYLNSPTVALTTAYCDVEGGRDRFQITNAQSFTWGEGNIDEDPCFIDPDNGNYHLSADSPCIDSGDPDSPEDPDDTRADMGTFYFHQRDIALSVDSFNFGVVIIDSSAELKLIIGNRGLTGLEVTAIEVDDEAFTHNFTSDTTIQAEGEYELTITFSPREITAYEASLVIASNDPVDNEITVDLSGIGIPPNAVDDKFILYPSSFSFYPAFPNPFNSFTTISYSLPVTSQVSLKVFDLSGREVKSLVDGYVEAGSHSVSLSGEGMASGVYLARMKAGEREQVRKVLLVR